MSDESQTIGGHVRLELGDAIVGIRSLPGSSATDLACSGTFIEIFYRELK